MKLSLGIRPANAAAAWWPAGAIYAIDFPGRRAMAAGQHLSIDEAVTVTRANPKYAQDSAGRFHLFEANTAAITDMGLSIEPEATNLCTWSNDLSQSTWQKSGVSVLPGTDDPAMGNEAWQVTESSATAALSRTAPIPVVAGTAYTLTRFIRRANFDWIRLSIGDANFTNSIFAWFNLATSTLGTVSSGGTGLGYTSRTLTPIGNGYHRITITFVAPSASVNISAASAAGNNATLRADVGSGVGIGGHYILWQSQLEAGSATSPIPTDANTLSRPGDILSLKNYPNSSSVTIKSTENVDYSWDPTGPLPSPLQQITMVSAIA